MTTSGRFAFSGAVKPRTASARRAAHDDDVRALCLQRRGEAAHRVGERLAGHVAVLDERDEAGAGLLIHLGALVQTADGARVGAAGHGGRGGEHADAAVPRRLHRRPRARHDHAHDGRGEALLQQRQRRRGGRVAGHDDQLDRHGLQKRRELPRIDLELRAGLLAVGEARRVADVGEVLAGQGDQAFVEHGETAHARVEHADGQGGGVVSVCGGAGHGRGAPGRRPGSIPHRARRCPDGPGASPAPRRRRCPRRQRQKSSGGVAVPIELVREEADPGGAGARI